MNRQNIIQAVLNSPSVQAQIEARAQKDKCSKAKVQKKALAYCEEVFSNPSNTIVKVMQKLLTYFWTKFYSGTVVHGIEQVQRLAKTHQIVYVPCHRSHVDYLLLSYTIDQYGLDIPLIAAGNNLNMPIIGRILRGGGAFFIRRSFKGNALYTAVMQEYINQLVHHGETMEYFIEGGRSRTGLLLKPKLGMLSMTLKAYLSHRQKPLAFVPVYIAYEKIIEGATYQKELSGKNKKKETFIGSLFSILKLRGQFGQVQVGIAKPIIMDELLNQYSSEWQQQAGELTGKPDWYQKTLKALAQHIMQGINQASVTNSVNWLITVLMNTEQNTLALDLLLDKVAEYQALIKAFNDDTLMPKVNAQEVVRVSEQGMIAFDKQSNTAFVAAENVDLAQYYVNNTKHLFVVPALVATQLLAMQTGSIVELVEQVLIQLDPLQSRFYIQPVKQHTIERVLAHIQQRQLISIDSNQYFKIEEKEEKKKRLQEWSQLIN